jgi:hypothetical protein
MDFRGYRVGQLTAISKSLTGSGWEVALHGKGRIAEEHEFHSLKENAGRIPVVIRLQSCEVFMLEIKANGAGPAIA